MSKKFEEINVELTGGLGNQLFGWATGFALANRLNLPLSVDVSNLINRPFELGEFHLINKVDIQQSSQKFGRLRFNRNLLFREKDFTFDERFNQLNSACRLEGYFQSYKYFDQYKHELLQLAELTSPSQEYENFKNQFSNYAVLSIHIRRGDYVGLDNYHGLTSSKYFNSAFKRMKSLMHVEKVAIFSDDINIAKIVMPDGDFYISNEDLKSSAENLKLMSHSKGIIGSNSSFSWWASYISGDLEMPRIFPRPWFTERSLDTRDLLPPEWLTLGN